METHKIIIVEQMISEACSTYSCNRNDLLGLSRFRDLVSARMTLCAILRRDFTCEEIAKIIHRNHSSVIYLTNTAFDRLGTLGYGDFIDKFNYLQEYFIQLTKQKKEMINRTIICGRLGADVQIKDVKGKRVANISLATETGFGEAKKTEWHSIVLWNNNAERVAEGKKGDMVYVEGRITYSETENTQTNKVYIKANISADTVQLIK